ncbi:MAG: glycosyltransferase [Pseudomonadota bacterium]
MSWDKDTEREIKRLREHITALEAERDKLRKRDWGYQSIFDRVADGLASEKPEVVRTPGDFSGLSFVIVYYNIPQQIERTLMTCAPSYQSVGSDEIEVILVDNGSTEPLPDDLQERFPHVRQILRVDEHPSPVFALNEGIRAARFEMVAAMIDGAHMLSPGVVRNASDAWALFQNPVINVPQYFLGSVSQNLTEQTQAFAAEGNALEEVGWPEDGYSLFEYAVYPGENHRRSWVDAIESNCLITTKRVLDACGMFDERYDEAGAGFANLEIYSRLIHAPENSYVALPGEGTFHQDHRGVTTQRAPEERDRLVKIYQERHREITGSDAVVNVRSPFLFGKARRLTQRIPTISREFGKASDRILKQLANIYVARIRAGMTDNYKPVLSVGGAPDERLARTPLPPIGILPEAEKRNGVQTKELSYLKCLSKVHRVKKPSLYFEIGVDTGTSLRLSQCRSVGVDPSYVISNALSAPTQLFRETSDAFFADEARCAKVLGGGIDLAFIDGMHLAEYVLRDFIETEKWMRPGGVILFDDVMPEQLEMLERERRFNAWCGDVYKIVPILRKHRPDLEVTVFETFIGPYRKGLAVVTGVDPTSRVLEEGYSEIEAEIFAADYDVPSIAALDELLEPKPIASLEAAVKGDANQTAIRTTEGLRDLKKSIASVKIAPTLLGQRMPEAPKLSLVIVSYNMARELPRTLRTLSSKMQLGIQENDIEIIVVDNGSNEPADLGACAQIAANASFFTLQNTSHSPCHAINIGLAQAQADWIGVMIDGARMASPGLLGAAMQALDGDEMAVVGAHGFHLGKEVQSEAVKTGYGTEAEDSLLSGSGWEEDAYRLFDISVFSKSSGKGWRTLPSETTALFMHRSFWLALNGYDERFQSVGGGLANLDIWKRACERPEASVRVLLDEATFHQVHGGATTSSPASMRDTFDREYESLRGQSYVRPKVDAEFIGKGHRAISN